MKRCKANAAINRHYSMSIADAVRDHTSASVPRKPRRWMLMAVKPLWGFEHTSIRRYLYAKTYMYVVIQGAQCATDCPSQITLCDWYGALYSDFTIPWSGIHPIPGWSIGSSLRCFLPCRSRPCKLCQDIAWGLQHHGLYVCALRRHWLSVTFVCAPKGDVGEGWQLVLRRACFDGLYVEKEQIGEVWCL